MISLHRISRLANSAPCDPALAALLLDEILGSTRPLPLPVRLRLEASETLTAVSIGLGLSRFVDLTFTPTAHTVELAELLLARQSESGSFGSVSATAVAVAALLKASEQFRRGGSALNQPMAERIAAGAEAALAWLSEQLTPAPASDWQPVSSMFGEGFFEDEGKDEDGLSSASQPVLHCDPVDAAIALWQLASQPGARARLDADAVLDTLERSGARHDRAVAQLLDRASAAMSGQPVPESVEQPMLASALTEAA
ncbi:MAG: hypothetical protein ACIAQF_04015 [Phycisphaerales bacterium JB065]